MYTLVVAFCYLLMAWDTAHAASLQSSLKINAVPGQAGSCRKVRFATFNTSLNRNKALELLKELQSGSSPQAHNISAILQIVRPDVLLLNEFDYEPGGVAVQALQDNFLAVPQASGLEPLRYEHVFVAPVNTGVPSGRDFDHDGNSEGPQDCFGYGFHPGQYGMALLSRFPIAFDAARTFQYFLWKDMPDALLPVDFDTGSVWYSDEDLQVFRLSSKSHWDVPVDIPCIDELTQVPTVPATAAGTSPEGTVSNAAVIGDQYTGTLPMQQQNWQGTQQAEQSKTKQVHMLLHHPTPPVFDGRERRNMLRNHDEIRLFADSVGCNVCHTGSEQTAEDQAARPVYIYDDTGRHGGLAQGSSFVIMGDHNADPLDGESHKHAIQQLLDCCLINSAFVPSSEGGREAGSKHASDRTPPEAKTSSFDLRVDYVLPSRDLNVLGGGVWWPVRSDPRAGLLEASDHRPVYMDVQV